RDTGKWDLAAETYYLLARRFPEHRLTDRALPWLVQFYASSEAAHRMTAGKTHRLDFSPSTGEPSPPVKQASAELPAAPAANLSRDDRLRRAEQLGEYLSATRPRLYAEPAVRFAEVAAQRQLGLANPAL